MCRSLTPCLNSWTQKNQFPIILGGHNDDHHCDKDEEMIIVHSLTPLVPEACKKRKA